MLTGLTLKKRSCNIVILWGPKFGDHFENLGFIYLFFKLKMEINTYIFEKSFEPVKGNIPNFGYLIFKIVHYL